MLKTYKSLEVYLLEISFQRIDAWDTQKRSVKETVYDIESLNIRVSSTIYETRKKLG